MHSSARLWRLRKAIVALCSASTARPPRVITGLPRAGHALLTGTCMLAGKTWCAMRILTASGVGALVVLCVLRRHDLATAAAAVPPQALGALAALHLASLVARSEAWRLSLAALVGAPPSRAAIHAANAGAFVAGALEAHAALPARVALLRRLAPHHLPHPTHVAVADLPILLLEAAGAALLLGATGMWGRRRRRSRSCSARAWRRAAAPRPGWPCWPTSAVAPRWPCSWAASSAVAWPACGWCWPSRTSTPRPPPRRSPSPRSASSACCRSARRRRPAHCWSSAAGPVRAPSPPGWR